MIDPERITSSQETGKLRSPIADIITSYEDQERIFELVKESSFYYYTIPKQEIDDNVPHLKWETVARFYSPVSSRMDDFAEAQNILAKHGRFFTEEELSATKLMTASAALLDPVNHLVRGLRAINSVKATPGNDIHMKPGIIKILTKQYMDSLGSEKPEALRETLRRYIPRWMTHPIPAPLDQIPEDQKEAVSKLWSNFTSKEADLLIHPDRIQEGAPLHMVFKIASEMEKQDKPDLGYQLRTWGITQLLAMEQERFNDLEKPEIPFFTYIMAGLTSGFSFSYAKNVFFDYGAAINDTMSLTHKNLQNELQSGEEGRSTQFISQLERNFPEYFPELFAISIVNHAFRTRHIDEVTILRGLEQRNLPWFDQMVEQLEKFPARRVLNYAEVAEVMQTLSQPMEDLDTKTMEDDAREIIGEEDSFSIVQAFNRSIVKQLFKGDTTSAIKIDLEAVSETIDVNLVCVGNQKMRVIPFKMSFSGEIESFSMNTRDPNPPPSSTIETLRKIVADALHRQVEKKRPKQIQTINDQPSIARPMTRIQGPRITRPERMALYQLKKEYEQEQLRKRRKTSTQLDELEESESVTTHPEETSDRVPKRIIGLDYPTVIGYLEHERIEGIEP